MNELMLKLEPMNPTEKPARSPVLNGVWEFLYTGGISPGTLAVQVIILSRDVYGPCQLDGSCQVDTTPPARDLAVEVIISRRSTE